MREIGRYLHKDDGDPFLNTATFAILKSLGTTPNEKEVLKTISKGLDTYAFSIFSISIGMLSGPTDLPVFNLYISVLISIQVTGKI